MIKYDSFSELFIYLCTMDYLTKLFDKLTCKKRIYFKIFMFGLDNSGKTSILFKLKDSDSDDVVITHGFNVENVNYKNVTLVIWDLGRRTLMMSVQELWRRYFVLPNHQFRGLIYVVDSTDLERMEEARDELKAVLDETDGEIALLVLANKQDLPDAIPIEVIVNQLKLVESKVSWHIQGICAISGKGLNDALEWLYDRLISPGT